MYERAVWKLRAMIQEYSSDPYEVEHSVLADDANEAIKRISIHYETEVRCHLIEILGVEKLLTVLN